MRKRLAGVLLAVAGLLATAGAMPAAGAAPGVGAPPAAGASPATSAATAAGGTRPTAGFVVRKGDRLYADGKPFRSAGTNNYRSRARGLPSSGGR
ncbi:hypothetical protein GCM10011608_04280 [Micromonospora sonchi]|uniref:Uncharacterized protein n=1 Tax=Micromonospora sonchi TaxID=1763543 RepID=A0A917THB1_9ACTN|nr:hypothetical protein [Micromonospora sonchi]GGM22635.1 hypothetical protein GCM10011608_04280 [Micromonospora sonchi]